MCAHATGGRYKEAHNAATLELEMHMNAGESKRVGKRPSDLADKYNKTSAVS